MMRATLLCGALAVSCLGAGSALAQTPDLEVEPCYTVTIQATGTEPVDQLCLVAEAGPAWEICAAPDAERRARITACQPGVPRFVRARARNSAGESAASPNRAQLRSVADCNGDWAVSVSDFVCANRVIFGGQP